MISIAFVLSFVGAALVFILSIIIFAEVSDSISETFPAPILITETNATGFTNITPIVHAYDEQASTPETHTGDALWTTIPNVSLSSGEFTPGNKYLLMLRADVRGDDKSDNGNGFNGANFGIRSVHGSTEFDGSELSFAHRIIGRAQAYSYMTVWTAVPSENITMEFIVHNNNAKEVEAEQISITAIELADFIENEDYFYNERKVTDNLECLNFHVTICNPVGDWTATNPSITFTANGSDDWLVMGNSQLNPDSKSYFVQTRLNLDDTILSSFHAVVSDDHVPTNEDITRHLPFFARVYTPSASSHTVEIESSQNFETGGTREYGSIFAINLDKFEYHADDYTPSVSITPINNFIESNTITVDFDTPEDVFIIGMKINNNVGGNSDPRSRMQINNQDIWVAGTSPTINHGGLANCCSQTLTTQFTMENLDVADFIDVDTLNSFVRPVVENQLVVVSMSAKTFEYEDQIPVAFDRSSAIVFTVLGILPIAMFFALFALFSPRVDGEI